MVQNEQLDTRSANLARQFATLESQLSEAQHALAEEKQLNLSIQSQLREVEGHAVELQEQLDEQADVVKQQEMKLNAQNVQVFSFFVLLTFYRCENEYCAALIKQFYRKHIN